MVHGPLNKVQAQSGMDKTHKSVCQYVERETSVNGVILQLQAQKSEDDIAEEAVVQAAQCPQFWKTLLLPACTQASRAHAHLKPAQPFAAGISHVVIATKL